MAIRPLLPLCSRRALVRSHPAAPAPLTRSAPPLEENRTAPPGLFPIQRRRVHLRCTQSH